MKTTSPSEFEPEPEVSPALSVEVVPEIVAALDANPESTLRHDAYINKKFVAIFAHEDRSGALAHAFEKSLSANDGGGESTASRANGLVAWFRAAREAEK